MLPREASPHSTQLFENLLKYTSEFVMNAYTSFNFDVAQCRCDLFEIICAEQFECKPKNLAMISCSEENVKASCRNDECHIEWQSKNAGKFTYWNRTFKKVSLHLQMPNCRGSLGQPLPDTIKRARTCSDRSLLGCVFEATTLIRKHRQKRAS